ncbi:MAG: carboxypeptidase-like regulatory domain-containing protein [Bacteroidetes bacterium]|nr:carboxypeptidase-like regulatory domain-containing protein [Bacteroidota bacterium]
MKSHLACLLSMASLWVFSQKNIMGSVVSESGFSIPHAEIYIPQLDQLQHTDAYGNFILSLYSGQKIRVSYPGYERLEYTIKNGDEEKPILLTLIKIATPIEEIKLTFQPSGDLKKDQSFFNKSTRLKKLDNEMRGYMAKKSNLAILQPQPGEFVQPVGPGFSMGKVDDRWTDVDLLEYLMKNIPEDFFLSEMKLKKQEIMPFIFFVFKIYNRKEIIHYGYCSPQDITRFQIASYTMLPYYKKNIPLDKNMIKKIKKGK